MDDNHLNVPLLLLSGAALTASCVIQLRMPAWKYALYLAFILFFAGFLPLHIVMDKLKSVRMRAMFTLISLYMFAAAFYCVYADNGQKRGLTYCSLFLFESALTHSMSGLHTKKVRLALRILALAMGGAAIWIAVALGSSDRNTAIWSTLLIYAVLLFNLA